MSMKNVWNVEKIADVLRDMWQRKRTEEQLDSLKI